MKYRITFISDLHNQYKKITSLLPGGDIIICAGDMTSMGYEHEIKEFCKWYNNLFLYDYKIFISGNHDYGFQNKPEKIQELLEFYPEINYLQDESIFLGYHGGLEKQIKLYGSPWQPEFMNWAFNLPRNGEQLAQKWDNIPLDTDILVTHGPPQGILDVSGPPWNSSDLGCELLLKRIEIIKPKIHVFGHIHGSYGYVFKDNTHFINASILNERYEFRNNPITVDWDKETNEINFIKI